MDNSRFETKPSQTAVVIGGGIGGLCCAAVLAKHFEAVVLIERDVLPTESQPRPGVPQGKHAHVLLGRGARELEQLFPGFRTEMIAAGAQHIDWQRDIATLAPEGWLRRNTLRSKNDLTLLMSSRILTEGVVRARVRKIANLAILERTEAVGLQSDSTNRVIGVQVKARGTNETRILHSKLIVDCSGRRSKLMTWLHTQGFEVPFEEIVDSKLGYASRWYERDPTRWQPEWWWKGMWIDAAPPESMTGGAMFPIEHGRVLVTLAGCADAIPPVDEAGFDKYMDRLRSPYFAAAVRSCKPVSAVAAFRDMPNRLRHFQRLRNPVQGLLACGDTVCSLSPIYAQGMSVAVACAAQLDDCLSRGMLQRSAFEAAFFKKQIKIIADAWTLATSADFSYPATVGKKPRFLNLFDPYFAAYVEAMSIDPKLNLLFEQVAQLLTPASKMLSPAVAARVLLKRGEARGYYNNNRADSMPRAELLDL